MYQEQTIYDNKKSSVTFELVHRQIDFSTELCGIKPLCSLVKPVEPLDCEHTAQHSPGADIHGNQTE
jgi:hypothetical protein